MKSTKDIEITKLKCLVYGKSGTGKTFSLDTLPKPLFVYSFDPGGMVSLRGCEGIFYEEPEDFKAFDRSLEKLDIKSYQSLAIDSLTTLAELIMQHVQRLSGKSISKIATIPTQADWMNQMALIQQVLNHIFDLPIHSVVTAHEELLKDELSGRLLGVPLITGKLKYRLPLYFSEVYHARVKRKADEFQYVFMTRDDALYSAKSRIAARVAVDTFVDQNFNSIWGLVDAQKGGPDKQSNG